MLSIFKIRSPSDRQELLKSFDPNKETWLVSDLKAKSYLQNELLKSRSILAEDSILRASELWRKIFKSRFPQFKIITEDLAILLIGEWLKDRGEWAQTPGAARVAYTHLCYLLPIFGHSNGIEAMKNWFSKNSEAYDRWGHWFVESYFLWNQFEKYKLATHSWISAHVLNLDLSRIWDRPLWVDLGVRILPIETEILSKISQSTTVHLIQPEPDWIKEYSSSMKAYDFLNQKSTTVKSIESKQQSSHIQIKKFSSPLGEVKDAVATIREWLADGVPLQKIACVAPQIKEYEDLLRLVLKEEGIFISELERADLSSFPDVHSWLCDMQVATGQFESGHLEAATFLKSNSAPMSYEEFIKFYKIIYDNDDLKRAKKLFDRYNKKQLRDQKLASREFALWALTRWQGPDSARLIRILEKFLSDAPADLEMPPHAWLQHVNSIASNNEERMGEFSDGIQVADLHSAENLLADHIILMGLTNEALRRPKRLGILSKDLWSIEREIGFNLGLVEDTTLEFDALWLLEGRNKKFQLSCAVSDWQGASVAPSLLWIQLAQGQHEVENPGEILWDFKQTPQLVENIAKDREGKSGFKGRTPEKLSISSIEDYLTCPFIFAAKKLLKCDDNEAFDLELGPQSGGRFRHRLLERLFDKPLTWTEPEIEQVIDEIAAELEIPITSIEIWKAQKLRLVSLALRFQEFEKQWRKKFPQTKTIARELPFEVYFDPVKLNITSEKPGVFIRGSIDRVDEDESGNLVIIDYKSSVNGLSNWPSWLENKTLQLGFYADVVASGNTRLGKRNVSGAFYMNLKNFDRERGFARKDSDETLFSIGRKKYGLTEAEEEELFKNIRQLIADTVAKMDAGEFNPVPHSNKECDECRWDRLCRGAHLL